MVQFIINNYCNISGTLLIYFMMSLNKLMDQKRDQKVKNIPALQGLGFSCWKNKSAGQTTEHRRDPEHTAYKKWRNLGQYDVIPDKNYQSPHTREYMKNLTPGSFKKDIASIYKMQLNESSKPVATEERRSWEQGEKVVLILMMPRRKLRSRWSSKDRPPAGSAEQKYPMLSHWCVISIHATLIKIKCMTWTEPADKTMS